MNKAYPRGQVMKRAKAIAQDRIDEIEETLQALRDGRYYAGEEDEYEDDMRRMFDAGTDKVISRPAGNSRVRALGTPTIVLVRVDSEYHLLTREDVKSLKYAAVSHSMWHIYAATVKMEYEPTTKIKQARKHDLSDNYDVIEAAQNLAREVKAVLASGNIHMGPEIEQTTVSYPVVTECIRELWDMYMDICRDAISAGSQDYMGRYLNELFSVYTARLGGKIMENAVADQVRELEEEYGALGFSVESNLRDMLRTFSKCPESVTQDFGRLAKIVPGYDVNPIYSYIDRAKKMGKPNPRGKAEMVGDFGVKVTGHTDEERSHSLDKLKCAARVMLTMSDIGTRALDSMTDDERDACKDDPLTRILAKLRVMQRNVSSAVSLRVTNDLYVPADRASDARAQARELVTNGSMPDNEYAGAYLDVGKTLAYRERGDPDIAILKASAIVSSDMFLAMSNLSGVPRATPTRGNDGNRAKGSGTMITDYLLDKFPSRKAALAFIATSMPIAATSDKIETNKYPLKTRVITSMCAEGRRLQGEYEFNNGKVLVNVPGFMLGIPPSDRLKRTYAVVRQDVKPGKTRLFGSLDLSSFSQGMHWDVQVATNDVLMDAYGLSEEYQKLIEACTINSYMIRCQAGVRLFMVNSTGSNYEGLDGKRNTFMHCTLWYLARCEAYRLGLVESMRAFVYIDDGAFSLDVETAVKDESIKTLREALIKTYTEYGFKLNLSKTVISESYMQFLNELFLHGVHIGYGFRALCHTAAQSFPAIATISEELAVITGGIRGAGAAGGHSLRLLVGLSYILWLYVAGVVGNKGRALATRDAYHLATVLYLPTIAGGWGVSNWTQLYGNLAGNRDIEKLDRLATMSRLVKERLPERHPKLVSYIKSNMLGTTTTAKSLIPDRITVAHPGTSKFGNLGRDEEIATAALAMCENREAERLIEDYLENGGRPRAGGVTEMIVKAMTKSPEKLPVAFVEKALSTDTKAAVANLVTKVASSFLVERILSKSKIRMYNRRYVNVGKHVMEASAYYLNFTL